MGRDKTLAQARPSVRWPDLRVAIEEHVQMAADLPGVSAGLGRPPAAGWPAVPAPHLRYLSWYPCRRRVAILRRGAQVPSDRIPMP